MGKTLSKGYITFSRKRTPKTVETEEATKPTIRSQSVHAETLSTDFDLAGKPYTTNQSHSVNLNLQKGRITFL